ncbi:MAG: hypothetical protein WCO60_06160 [Verrucomicrobiota bacterium]
MKHILAPALLFAIVLQPFASAQQPDLTRWSDDFSDATTLTKHWDIYGFLASGISMETPLGKAVGGKDSRPEWWQIVDGSLRGQSFPEEEHTSGIGRVVRGTDVRLKCRFKMPHNGTVAISFRGPNPIVEKEFVVAGVQIREDRISGVDNDVLHPKGSPEAEALKKSGGWNRKMILPKVEKIQIAPDVWHDIAIETHERILTATVDGHLALTYTTLTGEVPKTSVGFGHGSDPEKKAVTATWFQNIEFGPAEENPR